MQAASKWEVDVASLQDERCYGGVRQTFSLLEVKSTDRILTILDPEPRGCSQSIVGG